jgi:hypothetical protein
MGKQLLNFITWAASRVHPFCNLQNRERTHAVLVIGLYELLDSGTPASSTTKADRHDIAEILLKVALKHQKSKIISIELEIKDTTDTDRSASYLDLHLEIDSEGRVGSSCSTRDTSRINLVTNPVTSHERGKDREVFTTSGTYPWSFVTQISHNGQPSHGGNRKTFEVMTST